MSMKQREEQALLQTIDLLSEGELPGKFTGAELYGAPEETDEAGDGVCRVYQLSNETGTGKVTVYPVFSGIELYYNDMHMAYCNKEQKTAPNQIEINHCRTGRYECSFGENSCCYMAAGDLSIGSLTRKKSSSCFPLEHYHGITVLIDLDGLLPQVREIMELLGIDLTHIRQYICEENRCLIMRANPSIEHIFSELYHVREQRKSGYRKVKILELLLFMSDLDTQEAVLQTEYFNQNLVRHIKAVAAYITEDITRHETIEELSERFGFSPTALKKGFHGVYGTSVYAYLRQYQIQTAQKLLLETDLSVAAVAHRVGYENPNKFASAFREICGSTPTEYRKSVRLDR